MDFSHYKYDQQILIKQSHIQHENVASDQQKEQEVNQILDLNKNEQKESDIHQPIFQTFQINCNNCGQEGEQNVCEISIPYFKNMLVFSFICSHCGSHQTETKNAGPINKFGKKMILEVSSPADLKRDVYKSESASIEIPELQLELGLGSQGGKYTTIEGLIEDIYDDLEGNDAFVGNVDNFFNQKVQNFLSELEDCYLGNKKFTLIIDDPLDRSFIQNPNYPLADYKIKMQKYKRSYEQNEEFGLNDIKTDNYEED